MVKNERNHTILTQTMAILYTVIREFIKSLTVVNKRLNEREHFKNQFEWWVYALKEVQFLKIIISVLILMAFNKDTIKQNNNIKTMEE